MFPQAIFRQEIDNISGKIPQKIPRISLLDLSNIIKNKKFLTSCFGYRVHMIFSPNTIRSPEYGGIQFSQEKNSSGEFNSKVFLGEVKGFSYGTKIIDYSFNITIEGKNVPVDYDRFSLDSKNVTTDGDTVTFIYPSSVDETIYLYGLVIDFIIKYNHKTDKLTFELKEIYCEE